jgi:hypothetical protein
MYTVLPFILNLNNEAATDRKPLQITVSQRQLVSTN